MRIELTGAADIAKALEDSPKVVVKAAVRAMNSAIASGNTLMARLIATDTGIKVSYVKKRMYQIKASYSNPMATLATRSLNRIPLMVFGAKGPQPSRGKGRGVTAKPQGARKSYPNAFIAGVTTGHEWSVHTGVFVRVGGKTTSRGGWGKNLPIKQLFGPSLGRVFAQHRPQVVVAMDEKFTAEVERQLQRTDAGV